MELTNLVTQLSEEELSRISDLVFKEYELDCQSRQAWMDMHSKWVALYYQTDFRAIEEWQSKESIPVLTEACNLFQARAYKAFFPSRDFIQAKPMGEFSQSSDAQTVAEKIARHMAYQLTVVNRNYRPDKNAMFLATALHGCDFSKTYYDPLQKRNVVERVPVENLVLPYGTCPCPLDQIERKTHVIYKSINETRKLAASGYFTEPGVPMEQDYSSENAIKEAEDLAQGMERPTTNEYTDVAKLLEQHRLLDLDGDGIEEPYIVTMDSTSKKVLRIAVRWEVDPASGEALSPDKKPIEYFTQYNFLPNPNGTLGLGYGHFIGTLCEGINKIVRQIIDAATLANVGNMSGYMDEKLGVKGGDNDLAIGRMTKINKATDDIRKSIYLMQFPGADQSLVNALEMLVATAQRVSSTTDAVTGDVEKVLQPLTVMTMLESSLQLPSSVMEQMALSFEDEFAKLYRLNQLYFVGPDMVENGSAMDKVEGADYQNQMQIVPVMDPRQITQQQKMAKSQQLMQMAMENPVLATNPSAMFEITKRTLIAMGVEDIDRILPSLRQPEREDSQERENMYYLLQQDPATPPPFAVFPDQDHQAHVLSIDALLAELPILLDPPVLMILDPIIQQTIMQINTQAKMDITQGLMSHRREHIAYLYGGTRGPGQTPDMAMLGSNAMGASPIGAPIPAGGGMDMPAGTGGADPGMAGGIVGDTEVNGRPSAERLESILNVDIGAP